MKRLTRGRTRFPFAAAPRAGRAGGRAMAGRSARGRRAGHRAAARGRPFRVRCPCFRRPTGGTSTFRRRPSTPGSAAFIDYINDGRPSGRSIPTSAARSTTASPSTGFRTSSSTASQPKKTVAVRGAVRERRRRPLDRDVVSLLSDPRRGDHAGRTGSRAAPPATSTTRADEDRHVLILDRDDRVLYELYNVWWDGSSWQAYSGAALRPEDERPAAGRLDLGRRGGARDPAGARPLRRGLRNRRDPPRLPVHGPPHQRLRLSRRRTWPASRTRRRSRWARACA